MLLLLSVVAVACGASDDTQTVVSTETPTPVEAPPSPTPGAPTADSTAVPGDSAPSGEPTRAPVEPTQVPEPTSSPAATAGPAEPPASGEPTQSPVPTAVPVEPSASGEPTASPEPTVEQVDSSPSPEPTASGEPTASPEPTAAGSTAARLPADPGAPVSRWVGGINAAGWEFHRTLEGNAVSSPTSIGVAFSLSRAGASPDSGAVLDGIFGFPGADTHRAANAAGLAWAGASVEPTTLEVANRLFPDDEFSPRQAFLDTASAYYGAAIEPIDTADGVAAADVVNRWVSERTRGLIPTIVRDSTVQDQKLVLVNTVYLKADWQTPFLPELTGDREFTTGDGQSVTVPFMRDRVPELRRFVRLDGANAVELPYQGGELSMWMVVPHDVDGLAAVEEALDAEALVGLAGRAQQGTVQVTMPKWEHTLPPADLFAWLCPLGFCPGAGFADIAPGIFITSALHSAKVIVDEKGTEAAAATAMAFAESMPPPPDLEVVADRPFLWAITHQDTGALIFLGRVTNPAE
ncbi:serpin family protein [Candidatus Poriferisocius sp.]|uniref:serpin family protein n=1 Tax=Candidatus Poriferisocius sp. TaxID=3101276 RepID=UPI003B5A8218